MLLTRRSLFVREQVRMLKLTDVYDLLDPVSGELLGQAEECPEHVWLRLLVNQQLLPTRILVREAGGEVVLTLRKPWAVLRVRLEVCDGQGRVLGRVRSKLFSLTGKLLVEDADGRPLGEFSGGLFSWTRHFTDPAGAVVGVMDKKWSGLGRELFTSADNYHLEVHEPFAGRKDSTALLLAACLAYDLIFAEN